MLNTLNRPTFGQKDKIKSMPKYDEIALQIYDQIQTETLKIESYPYISTDGLNQIFIALLDSILQKIRDEVMNM